MKGHYLTNKEIEKFRNYLREEEKSENTMEKYIRDVTAFSAFCDGTITKDTVIAYKQNLIDSGYAVRSMKNNAVSIFEIDEHLTAFSESLHTQLKPDFADYGISLERFFVTQVVKPDGDRQYEKFKELHFRQYADIAEAKLRQQTDLIYAQTEAQKVIIDSQAQATKRAQEGYTYAQERGFDVAQTVAANEAVGQFTNMGVGLGTMAGVGGVVGGVVGNAVNGAMNAAAETPAPASAAPADDMAAFKAKVEKLTVMKDAGLITEDEFKTMKTQLLASIM